MNVTARVVGPFALFEVMMGLMVALRISVCKTLGFCAIGGCSADQVRAVFDQHLHNQMS